MRAFEYYKNYGNPTLNFELDSMTVIGWRLEDGAVYLMTSDEITEEQHKRADAIAGRAFELVDLGALRKMDYETRSQRR